MEGAGETQSSHQRIHTDVFTPCHLTKGSVPQARLALKDLNGCETDLQAALAQNGVCEWVV